MDIRQGGDCCDMWLILGLKGVGKTSFVGGGGGGAKYQVRGSPPWYSTVYLGYRGIFVISAYPVLLYVTPFGYS